MCELLLVPVCDDDGVLVWLELDVPVWLELAVSVRLELDVPV